MPIIRRKSLYLCDTGIRHSVWVVSGLLVGFNPTSNLMGTWMPETRTEEKSIY